MNEKIVNSPYHFNMKEILRQMLVCNQHLTILNIKTWNFVNLDLEDDDDDSLMRQVLAMSQIEYVETLKKQQQQSSKSDDPNQPSSSSDTHLL